MSINFPLLLVIAVAVCGFLALIVLMIRANQNVLLVSPFPIPMHFFKARAGIPYGVAIGAAAFSTYPNTEIFKQALSQLY